MLSFGLSYYNYFYYKIEQVYSIFYKYIVNFGKIVEC